LSNLPIDRTWLKLSSRSKICVCSFGQ
jgi:hypothetical protein